MEPGNYKYRLLIENLPDAFAYHRIITDSSGNPVDYIFLDVNPAFEQMTGLSREQVIGKKAAELNPGIENCEEVFRTIMSGKEWDGEVKMYAKDGQVLDIHLRAFPNKDDNGNITGIVGIHTDITKRKRGWHVCSR